MILIKTNLPKNRLKVNFQNNKLKLIIVEHKPINKFPIENLKKYFNEIFGLIDEKKYKKIKKNTIVFKNFFICMESFRDIMDGIIDKIINDNSNYESNKLGSFGFLLGRTKPCRVNFIKYSKKNPEKYQYLSTTMYTVDNKNMYSWIDIKKKFKYFINLPGHTYCTKIYTMLFCKRLIFYIEPKLKFEWENNLKPWIHYVPVKYDLSDLEERYEWAESNPEKAEEIVDNAFNYGMEVMCPEIIKKKLSKKIESNLF